MPILKALGGYDWAEVFGEGSGGNCGPIEPDRAPGDPVSKATFSRADVAHIEGQCEGENDGDCWIVWGRLKDRRWFIASGSCDYTGWDCQASNQGSVASTRKGLIQFGMTDSERKRFKRRLPK